MKKIALSALLVLSSAAFAGGRNASGPQNPPNPPTPQEQQVSRLCADFYESKYPGLNRAEANLPERESDTIMTVVPNNAGQIVANGFCILVGPLAAVEAACHWARSKGISCVSGPEWQFTRPDVP